MSVVVVLRMMMPMLMSGTCDAGDVNDADHEASTTT